MCMDTLQRGITMQNNSFIGNEKEISDEIVMELRKKIYWLEAMNIRKKVPQSNTEMVEKLIKEIKRAVEKEGMK